MTQYNALPFLVINYGVEMIYVLHSRLVAQNVSKPKVERVMTDLAGGMLNSSFLDELFRPQELYNEAAARSLFASLCDVSIIHLDTTSTQKLYDLIAVGVKYQLITLHHPMELVELTLNHLDGLHAIAPSCSGLIDGVKTRFQQLVSSIPIGDLATIRQRLLNFSNTCRIRGSLLLEKGLQKPDGTFCIPSPEHLPPSACSEAPGYIRNYTVNPPTQIVFPHLYCSLAPPAHIPRGSWNPFQGQRMTCSGLNIYEQRGVSVKPHPATGTTPTSQKSQPPSSDAPQQLHAYQSEIAYLCKLVGTHTAAPQMDRIQLDIFQDDTTSVAAPPCPVEPSGSTAVRMDAAAIQRDNKQLLSIIGGLGKASGQPTNNNDDLLDLMDNI